MSKLADVLPHLKMCRGSITNTDGITTTLWQMPNSPINEAVRVFKLKVPN